MTANTPPACPQRVIEAFPRPRMAPYLVACDGSLDEALGLYAWNAQMAGACLEQLGHLEVLLRTAIDTQMREFTEEARTGIPWFLTPPFANAQPEAVESVRARLRPLGKETRDQIVAGLSFGYWTGWLGVKYEDLWRSCLHRAFPHGNGRRKRAAAQAERVRKFRNRIAHHDSLISVDIGFEMASVFALAHDISPEAEAWMRDIDRTKDVGRARPVDGLDAVVVPAVEALPLYNDHHVYLCQPGRYFREVEHIAFYADRRIASEVPKVKRRIDNVLWSTAEANRLLGSDARDDRSLGTAMQAALAAGWTAGAYQVFILSAPGEPGHITLDEPIPNHRRGRSSAFVRRQRYTSRHRLRHARDVEDL